MLRRTISWTKWKNRIHRISYVILYLIESSFSLFTPSTGHSTGILSHIHPSPHTFQAGTIHIRICKHVEWERSKVLDHYGEEPLQVIGKFNLWQIRGDWVETNESEVCYHMEWTRGYHSKAWVWHDSRNYHVFREFDQYQVEFTCEKCGKIVFNHVRHARHVQTHPLRFLLQCAQEHIQ